MQNTVEVKLSSIQSLLLALVSKGVMSRSTVQTLSYSEAIEVAADHIDPIPISSHIAYELTLEQEAKLNKLIEHGVPTDLLATMPGQTIDAYFAYNFGIGSSNSNVALDADELEDEDDDLGPSALKVDVAAFLKPESNTEEHCITETTLGGIIEEEEGEEDFDSLVGELEGNEQIFRTQLIKLGHTDVVLNNKGVASLGKMVDRYSGNSSFIAWSNSHHSTSDFDELDGAGMARGRMRFMSPAVLKLTRWKLKPLIDLRKSDSREAKRKIDAILTSNGFNDMQSVTNCEDLETSLIDFGFRRSYVKNCPDQRIYLIAWLLDIVDRYIYE